MSIVKHCTRLGQTGVRQFTTSHVVKTANTPEATEMFKKLQANQELFQKDDFAEEVFVKKGLQDNLIYKAVLAGTMFGVGLTIKNFYELASC